MTESQEARTKASYQLLKVEGVGGGGVVMEGKYRDLGSVGQEEAGVNFLPRTELRCPL